MVCKVPTMGVVISVILMLLVLMSVMLMGLVLERLGNVHLHAEPISAIHYGMLASGVALIEHVVWIWRRLCARRPRRRRRVYV